MKRNERSEIGKAVQVRMAKQENKIEATFPTKKSSDAPSTIHRMTHNQIFIFAATVSDAKQRE